MMESSSVSFGEACRAFAGKACAEYWRDILDSNGEAQYFYAGDLLWVVRMWNGDESGYSYCFIKADTLQELRRKYFGGTEIKPAPEK